MSENHGNSGGIGFVGLLTIVFIVLKLVGKITWSWWWVLSPLWIAGIGTLIVVAGVLLYVARADRSEEARRAAAERTYLEIKRQIHR